jgi:2-polyprenyl-6-methoxyphenol hydroxylase-like FAD-dependent oxidoreductase
MHVACVGGGPAGLYLAILLKRADSSLRVTVFERNPSGVTHGWGVVFWDDLLADLRRSDPETASEIEAQAFRWVDQVVDVKGRGVVRGRGTGYSIRRRQLLAILGRRAAECGVDLRYGHPVTDPAGLDADLIVAADGVGSPLRRLQEESFKTAILPGRNRYVWLGTTKVFSSFTFAFVPTEAGWVWFHAYGCDRETSTLIVECGPETWTGLGLDALDRETGLRRLETLFADQLDGHPLMTQSAEGPLPWLTFRRVTNERWHANNVALIGDSAHTTHFSIGSGTRLAMQDAIALSAQLNGGKSIPEALEAYGAERRAEIGAAQDEALFSSRWFETIPRYIDCPPAVFYRLLQERRSTLMPRVPPWLYYRFYQATETIPVLGAARRWARAAKELVGA